MQATFQPPVFSFYFAYMAWDTFDVCFKEVEGGYEHHVTVRSFGNVVLNIRGFASCIAFQGQVTVCVADIYKSGTATVNGYQVTVTPIRQSEGACK